MIPPVLLARSILQASSESQRCTWCILFMAALRSLSTFPYEKASTTATVCLSNNCHYITFHWPSCIFLASQCDTAANSVACKLNCWRSVEKVFQGTYSSAHITFASSAKYAVLTHPCKYISLCTAGSRELCTAQQRCKSMHYAHHLFCTSCTHSSALTYPVPHSVL